MLVSWPHQARFNSFEMAVSVQYLYAFIKLFSEFDELGFIYCPWILQKDIDELCEWTDESI